MAQTLGEAIRLLNRLGVFDITDKVISIYDSANEAAISVCGNIKAASDIGKCCNGYINKKGVKIKTAHGYKWQWYQQFEEKVHRLSKA